MGEKMKDEWDCCVLRGASTPLRYGMICCVLRVYLFPGLPVYVLRVT